jgi:feruloyl esterase
MMLGAGAAVLVAHHAAATTQTPCTALDGTVLTLDGVAQTLSLTAIDEPAGAVSANPLSPAFCEVNAIVSSNANAEQSQNAIAVWLPETGWNGRFLGTGNGGFGGSIVTTHMTIGLLEGYAVANTDLGTGILFKCNSFYCGSLEGQMLDGIPLGGLHGDAAAISDFGYGATHLMTLAGTELIQDYYGQPAQYSYFHGCSTGGGQALMEAERYPDDYDGILAGSPAYDRTPLDVGAAAFYEVTHFAPDALLTNEALALAHAGVLSACAGRDGGLATDDYLTQPAMCHFDATSLLCTGAQGEVPCTDPSGTNCTCLVADQTVAMNQVWGGALDSTGRVLYPGFERGAEDPGNEQLVKRQAVTEPSFDSLDYWAFGPQFAWQELFAKVSAPAGELAAKIDALASASVGGSVLASVLNANSANLAAFNAHGGKLIIYAGYEDPSIPSASAIDFYNQAVHDDVSTPNYARLYLAPGMWHCMQGPGVNAFGNFSTNLPPVPKSASDDIMAAMVAWRERGAAPGRIIATHYANNDEAQGIEFQRPLCPYPENARYKAEANPNPALASSYRCAAGAPVENQKFSYRYGPR